MHREVSEGVSGDPQVLDMDKRNTEWNSTGGTHWKALEREYLKFSIRRGACDACYLTTVSRAFE